MTLKSYLDLWLQTYIDPKKAKNTGKSYRFALAHLSPEITGAEITEIQPIRMQKEINDLEAVFPRQAQILYTVLRAALKRAVKLHFLPGNPMNEVDAPCHKAKKSEYLNQEEAFAYVREAQKKPAGALLVLMLCLGLRRNEARGLCCGDLDQEGVLHVQRQRTRAGVAGLKSDASKRDLPVPEPLRAFFIGAPDSWVMDVSEKSLRTQHRRTLAAIGCERNVTLHGLRHSCATLALANGVQLAQISKLLGHAHYSLTADLYAHADLVMLRRCTNVVYGSISAHQMEEGARLEIV
ncbi:MAG: tyrosine-type recombinase/integrase [Clostridia bacterium]|nr:tyrosine-type recombinase/integrase [Clostridia bacterium]